MSVNTAPRPAWKHIFWSWCGGALAIGLTAFIAQFFEMPLLMAPFGASAVLAFGVPDSPLAQPRNIMGGHLLTSFVGLLFLTLLGTDWWVIGGAVATGIALMQVTRTVHPPAGANPILVILTGASWEFLITPVALGATLLTFIALVFNNLAPGRRYPLYWH